MTSEYYSHGTFGIVKTPNTGELLQFAQADLVKQWLENDARGAIKEFYRLKIAELLFPTRFIQVIGANSFKNDELLSELMRLVTFLDEPNDRTNIQGLFSKSAGVNPDHAVFSSHATLGENGKSSQCNCSQCSNHREFHSDYHLPILAKHHAKEMKKAGIVPPYDDPTDYCLAANGNLLFFEVEGFAPLLALQYLKKNRKKYNPVIAKKTHKLLLRYMELSNRK